MDGDASSLRACRPSRTDTPARQMTRPSAPIQPTARDRHAIRCAPAHARLRGPLLCLGAACCELGQHSQALSVAPTLAFGLLRSGVRCWLLRIASCLHVQRASLAAATSATLLYRHEASTTAARLGGEGGSWRLPNSKAGAPSALPFPCQRVSPPAVQQCPASFALICIVKSAVCNCGESGRETLCLVPA